MNEVKNPKVRKPLIYYYMMALLIMLLLNTFLFPALLGRKEVEVDYSTFTTQLAQGNIQQVEVLDQKIEYLLNDEEDNNIYITGNMGDPKLVDKLDAAKVIYGKEIEEPMSPFLYLLISVGGPIPAVCTAGTAAGTRRCKKDGRRQQCDDLWQEQREGVCSCADRQDLCGCGRRGRS